MFNIILYQPEIPPNTGNIIRLCANTGCQLHLIKPFGFNLDDKKLRRAGLDYHEWASVTVHEQLSDIHSISSGALYAISTKGNQRYDQAPFKKGDSLIFGAETRGLPESFLSSMDKKNVLRVPMLADSRSLNLSNTVAIVAYEALRQLDFSALS